jgi:hypothetical protein
MLKLFKILQKPLTSITNTLLSLQMFMFRAHASSRETIHDKSSLAHTRPINNFFMLRTNTFSIHRYKSLGTNTPFIHDDLIGLALTLAGVSDECIATDAGAIDDFLVGWAHTLTGFFVSDEAWNAFADACLLFT